MLRRITTIRAKKLGMNDKNLKGLNQRARKACDKDVCFNENFIKVAFYQPTTKEVDFNSIINCL